MTPFINDYVWTGTVNTTPVKGQGMTKTDLQTGMVEATGEFSGMPPNYRLAISGVSWWCVSCSNSLKPLGNGLGASIVEFTGGRYLSKRSITHILDDHIVGVSRISARASAEGEMRLSLSVDVDVTYDGPVDVVRISDYVLPLSTDGQIARGNYLQNVYFESGQVLTNFVECEYRWDGVSARRALPLQNYGMYFDGVTESMLDGDVRRVGFRALGHNFSPLNDVTPEAFVASKHRG